MNPVTADRRHFEDLALGEAIELGRTTVTRDMIITFAREFDPFPFHLDDAAAKASLLGGLAASGWQTAALTLRMLGDGFLNSIASMGGLGFSDLKWKRPVMVGDTIGGSARIAELRRSRSHPDRAILGLDIDVRNQRGEPVMSMRLANLVEVRIPEEGTVATPEVPYDVTHGGLAVTRWYEDIVLDEAFDLGSHTFTEAEIIRFGTLYDPQYFHVDPEAARHSHFGGLVASGWHTVSVGHRMMVDSIFAEEERLRALDREPGVSGPSPGVNKMEFKTPVRPGDTVTYTLSVTGKRASNSIPGWGLLFNTISGTNQRGELAYRAELVAFTKLRDYRMPWRTRLAMALTRLPVLGKLARR